jgi:hypothetical protein
MTLNEKRLVAGIEQNELPKFKEQLLATLGFEPNIEIQWDTFAGTDEYPFTRLTGVLFRDLNNGFKLIAKDDFGKEALKNAISRIKLENTTDPNGTEYSLANQELYLKVQLAGSIMKSPTADQFRDWIEKQL